MNKDTIDVFYSDDMASTERVSPSARKPAIVAEALRKYGHVEFHAPTPLKPAQFHVAHDPQYVTGVLALRAANGFGTFSADVARSLPYTNGAMLDAARLALQTRRPTAALCSGFHHAEYADGGGFCTFNGLMVAALTLLKEGAVKKVAIIDCDQHYGNGTDNILGHVPKKLADGIFHLTFGEYFRRSHEEPMYLALMRGLPAIFEMEKPDLILYQAGADAHRDDPLGGVLSTHSMYLRDLYLFDAALKADIPVAWNLAGGYQEEKDGSIPKVVALHIGTFEAARAVLRQALAAKSAISA